MKIPLLQPQQANIICFFVSFFVGKFLWQQFFLRDVICSHQKLLPRHRAWPSHLDFFVDAWYRLVSNLGEFSALGSWFTGHPGIAKHSSQNHRVLGDSTFFGKYYPPPHRRISLTLEQTKAEISPTWFSVLPRMKGDQTRTTSAWKLHKHSQTISISFRLSVDSCKHGAPCAQHKADFCCHAAPMDLHPTALQSPTDHINPKSQCTWCSSWPGVNRYFLMLPGRPGHWMSLWGCDSSMFADFYLCRRGKSSQNPGKLDEFWRIHLLNHLFHWSRTRSF